jgi:hypothetical protein
MDSLYVFEKIVIMKIDSVLEKQSFKEIEKYFLRWLKTS